MNRFRNTIALAIFSLLILALPNLASAQYQNNRNDDGYYGNNNNNRNNNNRNLQSTVKNLKNHSREFARRLDRELDRSRYNDRNREDRLLQMAQNFQSAAESLDNSYDNRSDYSRSQDEARRVLQLGSQLQRAISRAQISNNVNSDWARVSQDLQVLANAYNYNNNRGGYNRNGDYDNDDDYNRNNQNNRNGNRRTNNNNGNWRNAIPFPLPF